MLNDEIIQLNKFSKIHNNRSIIFCKTDYILREFEYIKNIQSQVVLITGNSDYAINDKITAIMPSNIKLWYAQNCITNHQIVHPIPMGIENKFESFREGHGISYPDRVKLKEQLLSRNINITPSKFIYANFKVNTNYKHRSIVMDLSQKLKHIDWEDPILTLEEFFDRILLYKMTLCPIGNGIDTHRLWEVLYSNRVPVTIKAGDYKIYKLYEKLPIVVLDKVSDLVNAKLIEEKYNDAINKSKTMSNFSYWYKLILEQSNG